MESDKYSLVVGANDHFNKVFLESPNRDADLPEVRAEKQGPSQQNRDNCVVCDQ